ncbi:hypothetical protein [Pseudomonas sp. GOM6]|uniref:hypothetical protein n=1 Tax=Pseudomonas sp. GOM6 TaxID=3036944 RepID=UPI002409CAC8|nr:hypothetical protein [Pseudomonas sp. GOM6]MDG1582114.1 hypothetical protein [Pseudomonas sp. GOM6]
MAQWNIRARELSVSISMAYVFRVVGLVMFSNNSDTFSGQALDDVRCCGKTVWQPRQWLAATAHPGAKSRGCLVLVQPSAPSKLIRLYPASGA